MTITFCIALWELNNSGGRPVTVTYGYFVGKQSLPCPIYQKQSSKQPKTRQPFIKDLECIWVLFRPWRLGGLGTYSWTLFLEGLLEEEA